MPDLPTGTVTFLFTDIEGSTALWEQHPAAMRQASARHDALVEQFVGEHHGHVVRPRGEGDSRFAVFARASDAVAAAAALQQALHAEPWSTPTPLRVRMAVHTGEADLREGDYYGSAVNRCARLRAVAHGGQTLVSLATEQLVRGQLAPGIALRDLGEHRLRDLQHSERIFQLVADGLGAEFPPLASLDATPPAQRTNLPLQPTSFIGRLDEIVAIRQRLLVPQIRLLTLTGPGGTGKTRLALQAAAELLDGFPDGVWLVELAPTHDAALVGSAIAAVLGIREGAAHSVAESLKAFLSEKHLLLVLDNFEQVLAASPLVAELLKAAPAVKMLMTSRAALHLRGEREVAVPPLPVPLLTDLPGPALLEEVAAVRLFVERAQDARADFRLTAANARAVAEICVRLDGLPLAIELAAARSKLLAPQALLSRLDNRLKLLTGGARDLPTRQQTLRATIDWSFSLLEPSEQRLFTRLGVFVGGWTVEAADAVCNPNSALELDVLDGLQSLLDKSLVRQVEGTDGEPRFRRLETIREYAVEQMAASGEGTILSERHARYYLAWLEALPERYPREHRSALNDRMLAEKGNLAAMVQWIFDEVDILLLMRWLDTIAWFGAIQSIRAQRRVPWSRWHETLMESRETMPVQVRAKALMTIGKGVWSQGDFAQAYALMHEGLVLTRSLNDPQKLLHALGSLGEAYRDQDLYTEAAVVFEEYLALAQASGEQEYIATGYHLMGELALLQGDYPRALAYAQASLPLYRATGVDWGILGALINGGLAALHLGDDELALQSFYEAFGVVRANMLEGHTLDCLIGFAALAASQGRPTRAVRLLGATEAQRELDDERLIHAHRREYEWASSTAQSALDDATWDITWAEGRAMTLEQAVAYALNDTAGDDAA